jgi:hypothetical protein
VDNVAYFDEDRKKVIRWGPKFHLSNSTQAYKIASSALKGRAVLVNV